MTDKVAVVAHIRPGRRAALAELLEKGPPFDLTAEGFEHHAVYMGDEDVVFLFTGPSAITQIERMAGSRALFSHVLKMTGLVTGPRLLTSTFEWTREHVGSETA
jgi:hypothetical protein